MNAGDPRFESWLTRETGIEASSLGVNAVARAVLERAASRSAAGPPRATIRPIAATPRSMPIGI